jgi:hypothetical protein
MLRMKEKYGTTSILYECDQHGENKVVHGPHGCVRKLLRLFGKHMKRSDIFKLLWSPFRRRTLSRSPELPALMIDSGLKEPHRAPSSSHEPNCPVIGKN